jgi:hypothetical protein
MIGINDMKHIKYILVIIFVSSASIAYSQYLEPEDINVFLNGYDRIKDVLNKYGDEDKNEDWIKYNAMMDRFSKAVEGYIRKPTKDNGTDNLRNIYRETAESRVPEDLEGVLKLVGWENNGNKKLLTITMGWGILYVVREMEKEKEDIPKLTFKIFVEKYYLRLRNILEIFNEQDLEIIEQHIEEIESIMANQTFNG